MTSIRAELLASYAATDYTIQQPEVPFVVHIGEYSSALAQLQTAYGVDSSAMITAWNPYSQQHSDAENAAANAALFADLRAKNLRWLAAHGADPGGTCAPEPGAWIAGISYDEAFILSRKYQQNAFVFADASAVPRLGLCE
jgi:hypothetical protein